MHQEGNNNTITTAAIFGKRAINRIATQDYSEWAIGMLEAGKNSYNLRMLAGLTPEVNIFEAEDHFSCAMQELQISEPDRTSNIKAYVYEMAKMILEGALEPRAGLEALRRICLATRYGPEFLIWRRLPEATLAWEVFLENWSGDYKETYRLVTGEILTFNERVKLKAKKFLDGVKGENGGLG